MTKSEQKRRKNQSTKSTVESRRDPINPINPNSAPAQKSTTMKKTIWSRAKAWIKRSFSIVKSVARAIAANLYAAIKAVGKGIYATAKAVGKGIYATAKAVAAFTYNTVTNIALAISLFAVLVVVAAGVAVKRVVSFLRAIPSRARAWNVARKAAYVENTSKLEALFEAYTQADKDEAANPSKEAMAATDEALRAYNEAVKNNPRLSIMTLAAAV